MPKLLQKAKRKLIVNSIVYSQDYSIKTRWLFGGGSIITIEAPLNKYLLITVGTAED